MAIFSPDASDVFRDHNTKFVPSSGAYNPAKSYIRTYLKQVEEIVSALATADNFQGAWDASTGSFPSGAQKGYSWIVSTPGTVGGKYFGEGDQLVALVNGASTSTYAGNWVVIPAWSSGVVPAVDEGAGTANAIQITTEKPASDDTIVIFTLFRDTTGSPVTVSINGGAALTVKTNRGNDASALTSGMEVWGRIRSSDNTFRLLNDQDVSALVGQAEAALAEFEKRYLGAKASDPSVDNEGNALIEGALYWNSSLGKMRVYHSSAWEDFGSVADGSITNAKLANMANGTIKGRTSSGSGAPEDLTGDQAVDLLGLTYIKDYGSHTIDLRKFRTTYVDPSNWSSVLQAAADSGEPCIRVHADDEVTFEDQWSIETAGQKWVGEGMDNASYLRRTTFSDEAAILVMAERCGMRHIGLKGVDYVGNSATAACVGILVARPTGDPVDLDFEFLDGYLSEFWYLIHSFGRGCTVRNSLLSRARYPVNFDWPAAGTYLKDRFVGDSDTNGMRRLVVSGCEFHSIGVAGIRNRGWNAANAKLVIENNRTNFGRGIFAGYLGDGSVIRGNTIQNATQATYELDGGTNWIMQGNTVVGDTTSGGFSKPTNFITMTGTHTGFVIDGFMGAYCTDSGIDMRSGDFKGILRNIDLRETSLSSAGSHDGVIVLGTGANTEVLVDGVTLRNSSAARSVVRIHTAASVLKHRGLVALGAATPATSGLGTITAV